jgi:transposase InsO family protein
MPVKLAHVINSFVSNTSDKALPSANDGPRQLLRSAGPKPCSCSITDGTRLDLWAVFGTEPNLLLRRPTVTIEIDVASRMILGSLVSFEPPRNH